MQPMKCSIVIATRDHAQYLRRTLDSIYCQKPPFDWEVIVIDDGANDDTQEVLKQYPQIRTERLPRLEMHSPGRARNMAIRMAKGNVVVQQSDEVIHVRQDTIERLTLDLKPDTFIIATVYNYILSTGELHPRYTPTLPWTDIYRPLFFLGSSWRKDLYRIGGYDPDFTTPGSEDYWITDCLINGLHLMPIYSPILGLHQDHPRFLTEEDCAVSAQLRISKIEKGVFCSTGGSWEYQK